MAMLPSTKDKHALISFELNLWLHLPFLAMVLNRLE